MADDGDGDAGGDPPGDSTPTGDPADHAAPADDDVATEADRRLEREIESVREDLEAVEAKLEDRTVDREAFETELKRYVRERTRRGKARGWGPYLVLLYGTAMTLGAFHFLSGGWAILAMVVVWLSTLGLYTFMVVTGVLFSVLGLPGRAVGYLRNRGS